MIPRRNVASSLAAVVVAVLAIFFVAGPASADTVTVGTVTASGNTVDVPVYIRDASGTPLGMDRPAGSRIQSFSIKVDYSPASAVQSVSFSRAGITQNLDPTSEFKPATNGSTSLLVTFPESTNLIPFGLDAAAPGDLVAHLVFTLSPSAAPGTSINLTLDPGLTQLTDSGGTAATKETVANGTLGLVDGRIDIPALSISLFPEAADVPLGGNATLTLSLSRAAASDTLVELSSSNTAVATVPTSVIIPANAFFATFDVTGVTRGNAQITATLGSSTDQTSVAVVDPLPEPCTVPAAPQLSAPASVGIGQAYNVTWNAVTGATGYVLEEATSPAFTAPTTQPLTGTSASFTHDTGNVRYYYRVRARIAEGSCDVLSSYSPVISVLVDPAPVPKSRVLPVVGSLPGSFGSFFRTSVQLYNASDSAISGRIVFHAAGVSGSAADPSLPYTIAPRKTLAFDDLLPAMSLPSGLGSADLIADGTSAVPVVLARVYNDAGASGTSGFAEDALAADEALSSGNVGVLLAPADIARYRLNIGVRTLAEGAAVTITVRDKEGAVVKTASKAFGPTFFTQIGSAAMLDGYVLAGGETITFAVTSGSAFVYGATTDNISNDPSVQFARAID
ncbi:MAG TPA: Ig-like domain-containing protein [Thermoanaerobaculia bacterium]